MTGNEHKVQKVVNSGTRLCSFIPETKNIVVSDDHTLKKQSRQGSLKMVSEFPPIGIIGFWSPESTILLVIVLGDRPDDFFNVLPGFKLKQPQKYANQRVGFIISFI